MRTGDLPRALAERASRLCVSHLDAGLYARFGLSNRHDQRAREIIGRVDLPVKAPDALHLAVAAVELLRLVTADEQLARGAEALGLDVDVVRGSRDRATR